MKKINGKPLIFYTINICKKIFSNERIIVTSDSKSVQQYCKSIDLQLNYLRPKYLSEDNTPMIETVKHAIEWYRSFYNHKINNFILLQPTSPLRKLSDVQDAIDLYNKKELSSLVSVSPLINHPFECVEKTKPLDWNFPLGEKKI